MQRANGQMLMGHPNDSGERNFLAVDGNATRHLMQQVNKGKHILIYHIHISKNGSKYKFILFYLLV